MASLICIRIIFRPKKLGLIRFRGIALGRKKFHAHVSSVVAAKNKVLHCSTFLCCLSKAKSPSSQFPCFPSFLCATVLYQVIVVFKNKMQFCFFERYNQAYVLFAFRRVTAQTEYHKKNAVGTDFCCNPAAALLVYTITLHLPSFSILPADGTKLLFLSTSISLHQVSLNNYRGKYATKTTNSILIYF